jgi:hypothetical protein
VLGELVEETPEEESVQEAPMMHVEEVSATQAQGAPVMHARYRSDTPIL